MSEGCVTLVRELCDLPACYYSVSDSELIPDGFRYLPSERLEKLNRLKRRTSSELHELVR